jgi:hypothetical protein
MPDVTTHTIQPGINGAEERAGLIKQTSKRVLKHDAFQSTTAATGKTRPAYAKRSKKPIARRSSVPLAHTTSDDDVGTKSGAAVRPSKRRKVEVNIATNNVDEEQRMDFDDLLQASAQSHCSPSLPSPYGALETAPEAEANVDHVFGGMEDEPQIDSAEDTSKSASESSVVEGSASTEDTSATEEEDEPQPKPSKLEHSKGLSPKAGTRPRRSLGRVSYAEVFPDVLSDGEPPIGGASDDSASDVYSDATASTDTEDVAELMDLTDDQTSASEAADSAAEEEEEDVIVIEEPAKSKPKSSSKTKSSQLKPKLGNGIDLSLPPIDRIEDIFEDMGRKLSSWGCPML